MLLLGGGLILLRGADRDGQNARHAERKYEFVVVDPNDVRALKTWAKLRCQRSTVKKLASGLGLEPRLGAVVAHMARGLSGKPRTVVEETCKFELKRSVKRGGAR